MFTRDLSSLTPAERCAVGYYLSAGTALALCDADVQKCYGLLQEAMSKATPWGDALFPVGRVLTTPGAVELASRAAGEHESHLAVASEFAALLARHRCGDWGDLDEHDRTINEGALVYGERLLSAYTLAAETVWCITEWDRSRTTFLTPEEY